MEVLRRIDLLQMELVRKWHQRGPGLSQEGFLRLVEEQHLQNFLLWHEEDIARAPDVDNQEMARVKRSIDVLNQKRNDLIEALDESILNELSLEEVSLPDDVPMNSETPGSIIDRSSIMALKIYHMGEQTQRADVKMDHVEAATRKVRILQIQREDLMTCLVELIDEVRNGTRRFKLYKQFKMYNDPSLNPRIYQSGEKTG